MDLSTMGRVSGSTSRSSLGRDPRLRPSLSQLFLFLFLSFSFSSSVSPPFLVRRLLSSVRSLNFLSSRLFLSDASLVASNSAVACSLARPCVSQAGAHHRRGDVFKSLSRQESSVFVGKPIGTISPSAPARCVLLSFSSCIRDATSALTNGGG